MIMTNITPLGKLLLVKEIEAKETKSAGGLIITATAADRELKKATVRVMLVMVAGIA